MAQESTEEAGRAAGRRLAEQDVAAVGKLFASAELLEALAHLAWIRQQGGRGDACTFVRAFVEAYRGYHR